MYAYRHAVDFNHDEPSVHTKRDWKKFKEKKRHFELMPLQLGIKINCSNNYSVLIQLYIGTLL
jgi:hypothetical protein